MMILPLMLLAACASTQGGIPGVIPIPARMERRPGGFVIREEARVLLDSQKPLADRAAIFLADLLRLPLDRRGDPDEHTILLTHDEADPDLGPEGYSLEVDTDGVVIRAPEAAGLFYGAQTLRQLLPPEGGDRIPAVIIEDRPRFVWRGMHLDVGRHFFPPGDIKRFLDLLGMHKFNTFHWHLTEDQGWRIEIKKWPKLVEVGSRRAETGGDGTPYEGHYRQDEIREIVGYARDRFITIVPEIEMPGHSQAAVAAYPELGNTGEPVPVRTRWGVSEHVYNVEETTFAFLEDVLTEVMDLFPGTFIHIGGDECPKKQWKESETARARMESEGLEDEHELQSWFIGRVERFLASKGRRLIGWDEIQEGGLPPGAAMMVWRSWKYGVDAVRAGHDIVMSPTSHCYFDYYQGDPAHEPRAIGGLLPLEKVYAFDPVPEDLTKEEAGHVLGAQGNLWTEYIPDFDKLMYMAFPRAAAMAEVVWSRRGRRDYPDFLVRWGDHAIRLDRLGVNYRVPPPEPEFTAVIIAEEGEVTFLPAPGGGPIRYTTDGTVPTEESPLYEGPIAVKKPCVITAASRGSAPVRVEVVRPDPVGEGPFEPGLTLAIYEGEFDRIPDFSGMLPAEEMPVPGISLEDIGRNDAFAVRFRGMIRIEAPGVYTFETTSDDGSVLRIGGAKVVDNDGLHGAVSRQGKVRLEAGIFPLEVAYFERSGAQSLEVRMNGESLPPETLLRFPSSP